MNKIRSLENYHHHNHIYNFDDVKEGYSYRVYFTIQVNTSNLNKDVVSELSKLADSGEVNNSNLLLHFDKECTDPYDYNCWNIIDNKWSEMEKIIGHEFRSILTEHKTYEKLKNVSITDL